MARPLFWVGVAYTLGTVWSAGGQCLFYGLIGCIICMWLTGRIRQSWTYKWLFWLLPVFFVSGFVVFGQKKQVVMDDCMEGRWVVLTGSVCQKEEKDKTFSVTVSRVRLNGKWHKLRIYVEKEAAIPEVGDDIEIQGTLMKSEKASNPGQFDARTYDLSKGISYIMWPEDIKVLRHGHPYMRWLQKLRKSWSNCYEQFLDTKDAGVVKAVLMGDKSQMDEEIEQLYIQAGIVHILAISGLHISMIGMGIFRALRRIGAGLKVSACASGFLVLSYGVMTGFGASTQRAVIMFLVRMGAIYSGYQYDFLSAVSLAALILFITQPLSILQTGVWFSFVAVLSIGLLWPAIERSIPWQFQKTKNYKIQHLKKAMGIKMSNRERIEGIFQCMGPSLAVTIGTVPLTAFCYGAIPLGSFFLNLVVLPLMAILMPMAMAAGCASIASEYVACFLGGSVHSILQINRWLCCKMLSFPLAVWRTGVPPVMWIVCYYVILIIFCLLSGMEDDWWQRWEAAKKLEKNKWLMLMICLFILIPIRKWQPMIAFIDVGQGDGIFMRTDNGTTWLIDGGSSSVKELGKYRLLPFMNYYGEDRIDYACVTHSDLDHISGVRELLQAKKIRHLVMTEVSKADAASGELVALANETGTQVIYVTQGSSWISGSWQFVCVYPGNIVINDNINDQSMVLMVRAGKQSFLMTGDVTEEAEKAMGLYQLTKIDILKVAHHGSKYSSSEKFLKATGAKIAIISCGIKNRYGHPSPETLERLREQKMQIYLTMTHGAIIMPYKNGRFLLQTWLK